MADFASFSEKELPKLVQIELEAHRSDQTRSDCLSQDSMFQEVSLKAHRRLIELYNKCAEDRDRTEEVSLDDTLSGTDVFKEDGVEESAPSHQDEPPLNTLELNLNTHDRFEAFLQAPDPHEFYRGSPGAALDQSEFLAWLHAE